MINPRLWKLHISAGDNQNQLIIYWKKRNDALLIAMLGGDGSGSGQLEEVFLSQRRKRRFASMLSEHFIRILYTYSYSIELMCLFCIYYSLVFLL
ncbi:hypothetical protein C8R41DRAFT_978288 [Lentinula lateritia]|uniref:Uncharacterized protein n=1 Tax=Lentinula lateritia TaxID=40482 RepID=A0ABQ8VXK7_9AGAR|nr:hypothetical protein C8R41DRAFT_978288 [Lentinula lateritia]